MYTVEMYGLRLGQEEQHITALLKVWERNVLRKIFGPLNEYGSWKICENCELEQLFGDPNIIATIKEGRLR